jgi:D-lactate dehydrogenase (cytochrome)
VNAVCTCARSANPSKFKNHRTAHRVLKSAGYDFTHLLVGSEGTLGIIVEAAIRVYKVPNKVVAVLADFPSIDDATDAVWKLQMEDVGLTMIELLDDVMIKALNIKFKSEARVSIFA